MYHVSYENHAISWKVQNSDEYVLKTFFKRDYAYACTKTGMTKTVTPSQKVRYLKLIRNSQNMSSPFIDILILNGIKGKREMTIAFF